MSAAAEFSKLLSLFESQVPNVRRTFRPPLTSNEETDLRLNWQGNLPSEIVEVLKVANGQEGSLSGPFWEYSMLRHTDIYYRRNLYDYYFGPADIPLFEDGNGGFIFWQDGRVKISEPSGMVVQEFASLSDLFRSFALRLTSGLETVEERSLEGEPYFVWLKAEHH